MYFIITVQHLFGQVPEIQLNNVFQLLFLSFNTVTPIIHIQYKLFLIQ